MIGSLHSVYAKKCMAETVHQAVIEAVNRKLAAKLKDFMAVCPTENCF